MLGLWRAGAFKRLIVSVPAAPPIPPPPMLPDVAEDGRKPVVVRAALKEKILKDIDVSSVRENLTMY